MGNAEIDAIRKLLTSKARPVGWAERRQRIEEVGAAFPIARDITLEEADCNGVRGEWSLAPGSDASRVLLFFHGGGYCSGSIVSHRSMVTEAGRAASVRTLAIEYRLAPEHPYPAAHEDALKAWRFLGERGFAPEQIIVGGDSAGGNLTASLVLKLRELGEPLPACCWLASPWLDLTMSGETLTLKDAIDPLIHKPYLEELAAAYAGSVSRTDPGISPHFADVTGFPPTLIQVGSAETLMDDAVRFARKLGLADVPVTLEVWPDMIHAWPLWNAKVADGRRALEHAGQFAKRWLR